MKSIFRIGGTYMVTCPTCGGSGVVGTGMQSDKAQTCRTCGGSGQVDEVDSSSD